MSFRVTVNLCLWFNDHRQKAKIFINDDIKTIGDLERRIEKIFKINNFYLTSREEYLPSIEDVRILQKDDIVWVMHIQNKNEVINTTTASHKKSGTKVITENKKRPITLVEDFDEDRPLKRNKKKKLVKEKDKTPSPSKEKPKKRKKTEKDTVNNELNMDIDGETCSKKDEELNSFNILKEENRSNNSVNINTLLPVLHHHIKSYNKKIGSKLNEKVTSSTTSLESSTNLSLSIQSDSQIELNNDNVAFYKCKGTLSSYKKKVSVPMITDKYLKEKKVNIVKIEYLSGGPATINQLELKSHENIHHEKDYESIWNETKNIDITSDDNNRSINIVNQTRVYENHSMEKEEISKQNSKCDEKHLNIALTKDKIEDTSVSSAFDEFNQVYKTTESSNTSPRNVLPLKNPETITKNMMDNSKKCISPCLVETVKIKLTDSKDNEKIIDIVNLENIPNKGVSKIENDFISASLDKTELSVIENGKVPQSKIVPVQRFSENVDGCVKSYENDSVQVQLNNTENDLESAFTKSHEKDKLSCEREILIENISSVSKQDLSNPSIMREINLNDSELESPKDVGRSLDRLSNASGSSHGTSSIFSRKKHLSGLGHLLEDLRSSESLVTMDSMDSDHSEFITKRKRKRVRRRKKNNPEVNLDTSLNDSSFAEISEYKPKPIKTRARPMIHLKFEEEEGQSLKVVDVTKKTHPEDKNESYVETSGIDNITIESDIESSKLGSFNIQEEHILKSPSIRNLLPKLGDIIAFKILRITDNYTPEISSYIIGKVNNFTANTKSVSFDILNGLEQCEDPKGKLSIGFDEKNGSHIRDFFWTEIIDPRLLFP